MGGHPADEGELPDNETAPLETPPHSHAPQNIADDLFAQGPVVIFRWRAVESWPVEYVSPNLTAQFGYQPEDFLSGKISFTSIIHPEDLDKVLAEVNAYEQARAPAYEQEYRISLANHEVRWILAHTTAVRNRQGKVTHYLGYLLDITNRKQAEEALQASEEQYRTLINTSPDGITLTDASGKILMASTQALVLFGISDPTEVIGKKMTDFIVPEELFRVSTRLQFLRYKQTTTLGEYTGVRKDGSRFTFEANAQVLLDSLGRVGRIIFINRDITARKRADEALQLAEASWRTLVENAPAMIAIVDRAGVILSINQTLPGRGRDQLIGAPIEALVPAEQASRVRSAIDAVFQNGETTQYELANPQPDRSVKWFDHRIAPIHSGGQVQAAVFMATDITGNKRSESVLARRAQEMAALYETSLDITSHLELPVLLEAIVRRAAGLVNSQMGGLYLVKPDTKLLELVVAYHMPGNTVGSLLKIGEGFTGRIAQTGEPMFVSDHKPGEGGPADNNGLIFRRVLGVPLKVKGQVIGVINVSDLEATGEFTPEEVHLVSLFADQAAIAVENARLYARVDRLAIMDELTGVYNRRGLFGIGRREVDRSLRYNRPLSALFIDIDHFKAFNARYTHDVGDLMLREVATCCIETLRKVDVVARYGGDEFTILLVESTRQEALEAAERLREAMENRKLLTPRGSLSVTISIGVAQLNQSRPDLESLIHRADQAMYAAKEVGGNCMVVGAE